jgi:hypothetical protein
MTTGAIGFDQGLAARDLGAGNGEWGEHHQDQTDHPGCARRVLQASHAGSYAFEDAEWVWQVKHAFSRKKIDGSIDWPRPGALNRIKRGISGRFLSGGGIRRGPAFSLPHEINPRCRNVERSGV